MQLLEKYKENFEVRKLVAKFPDEGPLLACLPPGISKGGLSPLEIPSGKQARPLLETSKFCLYFQVVVSLSIPSFLYIIPGDLGTWKRPGTSCK